jgi:hypothetical protein
MGRPTTYTTEIAEEICFRISCGDSVAAACADEEMPAERTVYQWLARRADFAQNYVRARQSRADKRFESCDQVLEDLRLKTIDAAQARVIIDTIKWQCGKEASKKYGDRLELAGDTDNPLAPPKIIVEFINPKD